MDSKERTKQHFNQTASDYNSSSDGKFVEPMYEVIIREIQKLPSGKILDVGCGNGNLFILLPEGKYELFGVDFSENMIAEAKKSAGKRRHLKLAMPRIFLLMMMNLMLLSAMHHSIIMFIQTRSLGKCIVS